MINSNVRGRSWLRLVGVVVLALVLASCSDRLEKDGSDSAESVPSAQLQAWSELHSDPYGIGQRALQSYAYAAAAMAKAQPECGLGWATLAGIGSVSSDHGEASGSTVGVDGMVTPEMRNLRQSRETGAKVVSDTDAGHYDGSSVIDARMGPMQILPSQWEQFATDADNDGKPNPDSFDDSTLTAARLLCGVGDLRKSENWSAAVGQFNSMPGFVEKVHAAALRYGR
ncbi:hypothetical protein [Gordonia sp. (in: high G+C Gram-positive bacteria)]|uniref:hypothetical protein n=1 Tax=Gordonia sp. (in: high G+C Gram-positive bacteria) TaxID=84139 RepID=UPI003C759C85